jgi:hypothetical protein
VEGEKALGLASRFESPHLPFSLTGRLMWTPLQFSGVARTELLTPDSNRFISDDDSTFGGKILDVSEAQAEAMVNPDGIVDDLWGETMTVIARPVVLHPTSVQFVAQVDNAESNTVAPCCFAPAAPSRTKLRVYRIGKSAEFNG